MKEELLSVIVPIYNCEQYLSKCVDSIINSTYKNLEIILVDDGSIDNSGVICDEYSKKDNRIKVYHEVNSGPSIARNFGLSKMSGGGYVTFVDSDDWVEPKMYTKLINIANETKLDIVGCATATHHEDGSVTNNYIGIPEGKIKKETVIRNILEGRHAWGSCYNKIFNKSLFLNNRFPDGIFHLEDYYLITRLFTEANGIYFSQQPMYNYNSREGSLSKKGWYERKIEVLEMSDMICSYLSNQNYNEDLSKSISYFGFSNYAQTLYQLHKSNAANKNEIMKKYKTKAMHLLFSNIKNGPRYWNIKLIGKMAIALI